MQNNINSNDCIKGKISLSKKFQKVDISEEEYQTIIHTLKTHYIVDKENNFIGVVKKNKAVSYTHLTLPTNSRV